MTAKEAAEIIGSCDTNIKVACRDIIISAIRKQVPQPPEFEVVGLLAYSLCPVCRQDLTSGKAYCGNCGQRIDWHEAKGKGKG